MTGGVALANGQFPRGLRPARRGSPGRTKGVRMTEGFLTRRRRKPAWGVKNRVGGVKNEARRHGGTEPRRGGTKSQRDRGTEGQSASVTISKCTRHHAPAACSSGPELACWSCFSRLRYLATTRVSTTSAGTRIGALSHGQAPSGWHGVDKTPGTHIELVGVVGKWEGRSATKESRTTLPIPSGLNGLIYTTVGVIGEQLYCRTGSHLPSF